MSNELVPYESRSAQETAPPALPAESLGAAVIHLSDYRPQAEDKRQPFGRPRYPEITGINQTTGTISREYSPEEVLLILGGLQDC